MKKNNLLTLAASIAFVGFSHDAEAVGSMFFGEDLAGGSIPLASTPNADAAQSAFLSNLIGVGTETFEGFSAGTPAPLGIAFPGAGTATLTGTGSVIENSGGFLSAGRYAISGSKFWNVESGATNFTITFDSPVAAFGFHGIDIGDFSGQVQLNFINGGSELVDVPHTVNAPNGSVLYFGYIDESNPFNSVSFVNTGSGEDFFAFDNMTIGSVEQVQRVPENGSSLAFLLAGLVGLVGMARNTRAQEQL